MKRSKKLHLSRETLRRLDAHVLGAAGGGGTTTIRLCPDIKDTGSCEDDPIYTGPFYGGCPSYGNYCTVGCGTASC